MPYAVSIHKQARKKLLAMNADHRHRVAQAINELGINPDNASLNVKPMQGVAAHLWRMRVGDWRVIYDRDDTLKIIAIEKIGARGDVYK
jgi:mRNA interferase RelE/StbE